MQLLKTSIQDLFIIVPQIHEDERGNLFESYHQKKFEALGINLNFVQDNQSTSKYGTIRGLHLQQGASAQTKLLHVSHGKIWDITLDLRPASPTYKKHFAVELSCHQHKHLLIPKGVAHGFSVLSETATVFYKCDAFYDQENELGIIYNDKELDFDWRIPDEKIVVSQKDLSLPSMKHFPGYTSA